MENASYTASVLVEEIAKLREINRKLLAACEICLAAQSDPETMRHWDVIMRVAVANAKDAGR